MLALRPVQLSDLPQLQQLARDSLVGVTSPPDDTGRLREKILDSCASFETAVQSPGAENYFFVLADLASGKLTEIGIASCRERGCQYVKISVVDEALKKKKLT